MLDHTAVKVIKVERKYYDAATGNEITEKEEFIESLTHDSYIIQIPALKEKRQNELEMLLGVFDQSKLTSDKHILNIKEDAIPKKYQIIVRRLIKACEEPEVRYTMDIEDEIVEDLEDMERLIDEKDKIIDELRKNYKNRISIFKKGVKVLTTSIPL